MDKSGANKAAIDEINRNRDVQITVRQLKYLNNIVEQDHRAIKRVTKPTLNFKSFRSASNVLTSIELMHMIRKGQFAVDGATAMSFADQFMRWRDKSIHCNRGPCPAPENPSRAQHYDRTRDASTVLHYFRALLTKSRLI